MHARQTPRQGVQAQRDGGPGLFSHSRLDGGNAAHLESFAVKWVAM